jgi:GT2 family glycosyltransferase/glycosyltransferase involved in cell wall biosynthesis
MRVLVIAHGFPPLAEAGAEIVAHAHASALHQQFGDEVVVFTREADPGREEYAVRTEERGGLRIVWVNNTYRGTRRFEDTYRNDAITAAAVHVCDDFRPEVAHIHHLTNLSTTIVHALAARRIPSIVTLHDYWFICHRGQLLDVDYQVCDNRDPAGCDRCLGVAAAAGSLTAIGASAMRAVERRLSAAPARQIRRMVTALAGARLGGGASGEAAKRRREHMRSVCAEVTHFVAPSRDLRDRFVDFGTPPERITVAPNGFDHEPFRRTVRTRGDRLRLGFFGSLMVSKAPHVLLDAVRRLPPGAVSVDLYGVYGGYHGDDSYREQVAARLPQADVRVHGLIGHDCVAEALASIDVLVVPSIWPENSPLVIQEAFLAGVPVVASRIGGIPEVVADGRNGLLFRAGDAADLAGALERLLREPGLLDALRQGIPSVPSIQDHARFARGLYRDAIAATTAGPRRLAAVVLNYRTPDDTLLAVKSLLALRRPPDDIIVVNNDAIDGTRELLAPVAPYITYLQTGRNLGYSGGINVGIRDALARGAGLVVLVNSDVYVPPDCIELLEACLAATPGAGIAGPVVLSRSEPDRIASLGMSYRPRSGRMRHRSFGEPFDGHRPTASPVVDGVSGCLMLVTREVFEAAGQLDEAYFFSFEDLDFCLKAREAGFTTVLAGAATVHHEGGRSIGATSPRRLYFAARNHLRLGRRGRPSAGRLEALGRTVSIVTLNLAYACRSSGASLPVRLGAVARGTLDYFAGRTGSGTFPE